MDNHARAINGARAITANYSYTEFIDPHTCLVDTLADLMHWADATEGRASFDLALETARGHHWFEVKEEAAERLPADHYTTEAIMEDASYG